MDKPKMLELFCGMKCAGEVFKTKYDVISLDYDPEFNATHTEDILKWDYTIYKPNTFKVIWASPDCTTWSIATGGRYRTKANILSSLPKGKNAELMIDRLIEIIDYFKPTYWFIENPRGQLQYYPPMIELEKNNYKMLVYYGNHGVGFPKATHIWSNVKLWENEKTPIMSEDTYVLRWHKFNKSMRRYYKAYLLESAKTRSLVPSILLTKIYDKVELYENK